MGLPTKTEPAARGPAHAEDDGAADAVELLACVDKILASEEFSRSSRLGAFVRFTVKLTLAGEADRIKESTIAIEVYGREPKTYSPKADPIVRTEARRLRSKLERYYQSEGRDDPVVVAYPKGSYVPTFSHRKVAPEAPEPERHETATARRRTPPANVGGTVARQTEARAMQPEAAEAFEEASYFMLQFAATRNNDEFDAARRLFEKTLESEPENVEALSGYGHLLLHNLYPPLKDRAETLAQAHGLLEQALAVDANHARSLALLGEIYDALGRRDEALHIAQRAVVLDPIDVVNRALLAQRYRDRGFYEAALVQIEKATESGHMWAIAYLQKVDVLVELGRYDAADEVVTQMAGAHFASPGIDFAKVRVLIARGDSARALEYVRQARSNYPKQVDASFLEISSGLAAALEGDRSEAERVLGKYADSPPRLMPHLEMLCLAVRDLPLAVQLIRGSYIVGNYRWLVEQPLAQPYLGQPEFRELLDELYARWQSDLRTAAPGPFPRPPVLPPPAEIVNADRQVGQPLR